MRWVGGWRGARKGARANSEWPGHISQDSMRGLENLSLQRKWQRSVLKERIKKKENSVGHRPTMRANGCRTLSRF